MPSRWVYLATFNAQTFGENATSATDFKMANGAVHYAPASMENKLSSTLWLSKICLFSPIFPKKEKEREGAREMEKEKEKERETERKGVGGNAMRSWRRREEGCPHFQTQHCNIEFPKTTLSNSSIANFQKQHCPSTFPKTTTLQ